jgi:DNA anti-recombination protein RmuC
MGVTMANTKLIHLANAALDLNLEVTATLHDEYLRKLADQVQVQQDEVNTKLDSTFAETDKAFTKLHQKDVWKNSKLFGQTLKSLITAFMLQRELSMQQRRLEALEDGIEEEQFRRATIVIGCEHEQVIVLEAIHTTACTMHEPA